ncbi:MAG: hypothetical protein ACFCD0_01840 [Gemmataceae bacterium]
MGSSPVTSYYYYPYSSYYYSPYNSYYVPSYYYSYYYSPTVVTESVPVVTSVPTIPTVALPVCTPTTQSTEPQTFAQPVPAPPRTRIAPAPKKNQPKTNDPNIRVEETNERYFRGSPVSTEADTIRVGFWNTTNRSVVLRVSGVTRVIRGNGGATFDLPRSFTWQIDQNVPNSETLAANRSSYEIFIQ